MNILRWIVFLPLALLASMVGGALASTISEFIGMPNFLVWGASGVMSAFLFIYIGMLVAPKKTKGLLISLTSIVVVLAIISGVGVFLSGLELVRICASLGMVVCAFYAFKQSAYEIKHNT